MFNFICILIAEVCYCKIGLLMIGGSAYNFVGYFGVSPESLEMLDR